MSGEHHTEQEVKESLAKFTGVIPQDPFRETNIKQLADKFAELEIKGRSYTLSVPLANVFDGEEGLVKSGSGEELTILASRDGTGFDNQFSLIQEVSLDSKEPMDLFGDELVYEISAHPYDFQWEIHKPTYNDSVILVAQFPSSDRRVEVTMCKQDEGVYVYGIFDGVRYMTGRHISAEGFTQDELFKDFIEEQLGITVKPFYFVFKDTVEEKGFRSRIWVR